MQLEILSFKCKYVLTRIKAFKMFVNHTDYIEFHQGE